MSDKKGRTTFAIPNWLIVAIIIFIIVTPLGVAIKTGLINTAQLLASLFGWKLETVPEDVTLKPGQEPYYGTLSIKLTESNYFDGAAASTSSPAYVAYQGHLGVGSAGVAITASGTDFDLQPEAKGIIYMKIYAGTGHYPVLEGTKGFILSNPRIKEYFWQDIDLNGLDDIIVKVDAGNIGRPGQALKPVLVLALPLVTEDVTGLATTSPADVTGVGTSEVVKQISWDISGCSEKSGWVASRLWFSTNETREGTDIKIESVSLVGLGIDRTFDAPIYTQDGPNAGDYSAWFVKPSDYKDWRYGILMMRAPNKADNLRVTVNVRCTFESNDVVYVQLELEYLQVEGITAVLQDLVNLKQA